MSKTKNAHKVKPILLCVHSITLNTCAGLPARRGCRGDCDAVRLSFVTWMVAESIKSREVKRTTIARGSREDHARILGIAWINIEEKKGRQKRANDRSLHDGCTPNPTEDHDRKNIIHILHTHTYICSEVFPRLVPIRQTMQTCLRENVHSQRQPSFLSFFVRTCMF